MGQEQLGECFVSALKWKNKQLVAGNNRGLVQIYSTPDFSVLKTFNFAIDDLVRGLDLFDKKMLIAFNQRKMIQIDIESEDQTEVARGHSGDELWGLCYDKKDLFATAGDDN